MEPIPQFIAELTFHFDGVGPSHSHAFLVGPDLHRRVPMHVNSLPGLNTVGLWADRPGIFGAGDVLRVRCRLPSPELFADIIKSGTLFELWDGGFIATGRVLERIPEGWPNAA